MIKSSLLPLALFQVFVISAQFQSALPIPIKVAENSLETTTKKALVLAEAPPGMIASLTRAVCHASDATKISPVLLVVLTKTESEFKMNATSRKGYKGLLQTPYATKTSANADIMLGAEILKEKLRENNNNLRKALAAYKGGVNVPMAQRQANEVLVLYEKYQRQIDS